MGLEPLTAEIAEFAEKDEAKSPRSLRAPR